MKIALAIPTIRADRAIHVETLCQGTSAHHDCVLSDKEPNHAWAERMRKWWLETGADFCLTLQDDSEIPDNFGRILRAQLEHLPPRALLGLAAVHPIQPEIYRQGHRWYRTRAWVCGWGWGIWREDLLKLQAWCDANEGRARTTNEDSLVNEWCVESDRDVWHPTPATVDHDTGLPSTYANDHHVHRRPFITWRDTDADLTVPAYWRPITPEPPLLHMPSPRHCWWCLKNPAFAASGVTNAALCKGCLANMVNTAVMR